MDDRLLNAIAAGVLSVSLFPIGVAVAADQQPSKAVAPAKALDVDAINKLVSNWPAGPQLAAQVTMAKYGTPQEATSQRLIWHNAGPYKRITVTQQVLPHKFPISHQDYLEHTISYKVPVDKTDDVHAFDASITIYPVGGELSARCDLESNNIITLNLANDVATGKKSVEEARKEFGQIVTDRMLGKQPAYATALQFDPPKPEDAATVEETTIPGAPQPKKGDNTTAAAPGKANSDAEILAMLVTLDQGEIRGAMEAKTKKISQSVKDYATMLHEQHGKNAQDTFQLADKINVTPIESRNVEQLHAQASRSLAKIVPLDGDEFARAYIKLMIDDHKQALELVDTQIKKAQNPELQKFLAATKEKLSMHLQEAQKLQGDAKGG